MLYCTFCSAFFFFFGKPNSAEKIVYWFKKIASVRKVLKLAWWFFFFNFYCYSITVVCLFSPSLHPTPRDTEVRNNLTMVRGEWGGDSEDRGLQELAWCFQVKKPDWDLPNFPKPGRGGSRTWIHICLNRSLFLCQWDPKSLISSPPFLTCSTILSSLWC